MSDGLTDKSDDVWMEGTSPVNWTIRKLYPAILMAIFTVNLDDSWMEMMTDMPTDGQTSRWNHVWVDRQTSHVTDIQTDLLWY